MSLRLGTFLPCLASAYLLTSCGMSTPEPLRVAMFFDNSMSTQGIHTYLKNAVNLVYKDLDAEDTVQLFRLGQTLYPLTDEKSPQLATSKSVLDSLDQLQSEEYGTSLGAALERACGFIGAAPQAKRRTVLVILTDAADERGSGTFNTTVPQLASWGKEVARSGAYVVFVGPEGVLRNRIDQTLRPILSDHLGICSRNEAVPCSRNLVNSFRL